MANHLFTVVPPCYELTTLLIRTLTYALGQSGIARRDKHGQLSHNTLYGYGFSEKTHCCVLVLRPVLLVSSVFHTPLPLCPVCDS